jgi:hypothetical protein
MAMERARQKTDSFRFFLSSRMDLDHFSSTSEMRTRNSTMRRKTIFVFVGSVEITFFHGRSINPTWRAKSYGVFYSLSSRRIVPL